MVSGEENFTFLLIDTLSYKTPKHQSNIFLEHYIYTTTTRRLNCRHLAKTDENVLSLYKNSIENYIMIHYLRLKLVTG